MRARQRVALAATAVAGLAMAVQPTRAAAAPRWVGVVAHWTFEVRGTIDREWTESQPEGCALAGSGSGHFTIRTTPTNNRILVIRSPYTGRLEATHYTDPGMWIRGPQKDGRVQNPPAEEGDTCQGGEPAPPGGCAPLAELYSFQMIPTRRRPGHATLVTGINRLDTRHTCGLRYFTGLTYGARSPVRIGYPTLRQFLHAKGPLTFTVDDVVPITLVDGTHRYEEKLTRHVVMTFTRRPFTSDPPVR